jgi:hypothetical protein
MFKHSTKKLLMMFKTIHKWCTNKYSKPPFCCFKGNIYENLVMRTNPWFVELTTKTLTSIPMTIGATSLYRYTYHLTPNPFSFSFSFSWPIL